MNARKHESETPHFAVETEYLITDVEELVNANVGDYLGNKPFRVTIVDYMPEMIDVKGSPRLPIGITRFERDIIQGVAPGSREFTGIDLLFTFPITKSITEENPINVELKWSDGIRATLALVDERPVALVTRGEDADEVLFAAEPSNAVMQTYLETVGLPSSIWDDDFKDLMGDIYSSRDIQLERGSKYLLDLGTTMEISHSARYMTNDLGDKELVQELLLNIDHTSEPRLSGVMLPGSSFRNMFRFERNEASDQWKYRGAYAGKLISGEFVDKLVQDDPKLGVPGSKLLEKAFNFLSEQSKQ
ncbi:hypothetical protein H7100_00045 [Candidatus Saccharibacteria bacterium]|nr:hypothetical protein [Candidatus Saccharibacteria bacterium]